MSGTIRRLEPSDDRTAFRSGDIDLDRFFARFAGQNQFRHHIGATYVAIDGAGAIAGFATVAASELVTANLPQTKRKRLPAYPLPVVRLARLAVDESSQGKGVGNALLRAAFTFARRMSSDMGRVGVVVDAKSGAIPFYEKLGFFALKTIAGQLGDRPEPTPMFIELGAIAAASANR